MNNNQNVEPMKEAYLFTYLSKILPAKASAEKNIFSAPFNYKRSEKENEALDIITSESFFKKKKTIS